MGRSPRDRTTKQRSWRGKKLIIDGGKFNIFLKWNSAGSCLSVYQKEVKKLIKWRKYVVCFLATELIPWYHQKVILNNHNYFLISMAVFPKEFQSYRQNLLIFQNPWSLLGVLDLSFKENEPYGSLVFPLGSIRTFYHVLYVLCFLLISNGPFRKPINRILPILISNIYFRFFLSMP